MKKLVSLALAIALLLACCALPALAEEPVTLNMILQTASTYNHGDPNRDMSVWEAIEKACNGEAEHQLDFQRRRGGKVFHAAGGK